MRLPIRVSAMRLSLGGSGDRVDDLAVAGAAAQVAFDAAADRGFARARVALDQVARLHDEARGAEAALHRAVRHERVPQALAGLGSRYAFDGDELARVAVDREH